MFKVNNKNTQTTSYSCLILLRETFLHLTILIVGMNFFRGLLLQTEKLKIMIELHIFKLGTVDIKLSWSG